MRAALLLLLLCAAACAQQDAALLVTMTGPYRIPADGNKLVLDVFDGTQEIKRASWCSTPVAGCDALPAMSPLSASVTLVESGAAHPNVKINAQLFLGSAVVGLGSVRADFQDGKTTAVAIPLSAP